MLDTDVLNDLTPHAELLATYADLVTDLPALQKQFPNSVIILIDRGLGDHTGLSSVADVENGAMTAADAAAWYDRQHAKGVKDLTIYCSRDELAAVDTAMGARVFYRWIATLDGTVHIDNFKPLEAPAAVQCLSASMLGIHADGSLVLQDQWHRTIDTANGAKAAAILHSAINLVGAVQADMRELAAAFGG